MIDQALTRRALEYMEVSAGSPHAAGLNRLIEAYVRHVPWESVSRIIKRHAVAPHGACARLPVEFWNDAITFGGGGTCFEINYAFLGLLMALGYQGYMTVNDMGERRGGHAAIIILLNDSKYLVDVSIPIYCAVPIRLGAISRRYTRHHTFFVSHSGDHHYEVERTRHPKRKIYTLADLPVSPNTFERVVAADYGPGGQFLDRVIIVKMIRDTLWRFDGAVRPYVLEGYDRTGKHELPLHASTLPKRLGTHFAMDPGMIEAALAIIEHR